MPLLGTRFYAARRPPNTRLAHQTRVWGKIAASWNRRLLLAAAGCCCLLLPLVPLPRSAYARILERWQIALSLPIEADQKLHRVGGMINFGTRSVRKRRGLFWDSISYKYPFMHHWKSVPYQTLFRYIKQKLVKRRGKDHLKYKRIHTYIGYLGIFVWYLFQVYLNSSIYTSIVCWLFDWLLRKKKEKKTQTLSNIWIVIYEVDIVWIQKWNRVWNEIIVKYPLNLDYLDEMFFCDFKPWIMWLSFRLKLNTVSQIHLQPNGFCCISVKLIRNRKNRY